MKIICFAASLALAACSPSFSVKNLPEGETGDGASVRAFVDVCALSNKGDGPSLFDIVEKSGYLVSYEVVQNRTRYEAKASSFKGKRQGICPIFISMEDSGSHFRCKFVMTSSCGDKLVGATGPFVKSELTKIDGVRFNSTASVDRNKRFNDGRYHVFDVANSSVENQQITLTYGGRVGGSVYLTTEIEPNHDLSGVMSAEEAMKKLLKDYSSQ